MLPKNNVPMYELNLPSNNQKITFRPFLVKEEKIMLMAAQNQDEKEIKGSIKQIILNCVKISEKELNNLPLSDIEWILINLRIRSVGSKITNEYTCNNRLPGESVGMEKQCNTPFKVDIDLNDIKRIEAKAENQIWLSDDLGVQMRAPRFSYTGNTNASSFDFELLKE